MKKAILALLLALSLLAVTGCSEWEEPAEDNLFQTLNDYYGSDEPEMEPQQLSSFSLPYFEGETVDPVLCSDGPHQVLGSLLYEGLFTLDPQWEVQPLLAESYSYDADSFIYTITLRDNVAFSDGEMLDAYDVIYTLQRARSSPRYAGRLQDMVSVSGSGNTVQITLKYNNARFPALLDIPIVRAGTEDRLFPVGTGPFFYDEQDGRPCLSVNPAWWRGETLPLRQIGLTRCKDSDSIAYAFYSQDVQLLCNDLTGTHVSNVYGNGVYTDAPTSVMQYIGINVLHTPLDDPALRQALMLGINRGECVDAFLLGHGSGAQFPVSPASAVYPEELDISYTPDHFNLAMEKAGYTTGTPIALRMIVNSENSFKVSAAQQIARDLSGHDIEITVDSLDWNNYLQALDAGDFDLYYGECRLTADWDLRPLLTDGGALNYGGYSDAETDALMAAALACDDTQREKAYLSLYSHLRQQCPILPVCFKNLSVLTPSGAVDKIVPTAANPFYDLPQWIMHIKHS